MQLHWLAFLIQLNDLIVPQRRAPSTWKLFDLESVAPITACTSPDLCSIKFPWSMSHHKPETFRRSGSKQVDGQTSTMTPQKCSGVQSLPIAEMMVLIRRASFYEHVGKQLEGVSQAVR